MTLINNIFGQPDHFQARAHSFDRKSVRTRHFQADERLRVYSTGDRFCYDGYTSAASTA
jgi:hypothetical protein